jgi:hypothetical protein
MTNHDQSASDDARLNALLRQHQVPAPSIDFEARVLRRARQAGEPTHPHSGYWRAFSAGAIAASLAALALWLTLSPSQPNGLPPDSGSIAQIEMQMNETRQVQLVFDSRTQTQATVTIELADNLELAGFGTQRRIEWRTELVEGRNLLELPIALLDGQDSQFEVALRDDNNRTQALKVRIHAKHPAPV